MKLSLWGQSNDRVAGKLEGVPVEFLIDRSYTVIAVSNGTLIGAYLDDQGQWQLPILAAGKNCTISQPSSDRVDIDAPRGSIDWVLQAHKANRRLVGYGTDPRILDRVGELVRATQGKEEVKEDQVVDDTPTPPTCECGCGNGAPWHASYCPLNQASS